MRLRLDGALRRSNAFCWIAILSCGKWDDATHVAADGLLDEARGLEQLRRSCDKAMREAVAGSLKRVSAR